MRSSLFELTKARVLETAREPSILFWVFGFPMLLAVVLGLAFRSAPVESIPVAVVEEGEASEWAIVALEDHETFSVESLGSAAADEALRLGRVEVVVDAREPGESRRLTYRFDPTRPTSRVARFRVDDALQRAAGRTDPAATADREVTESGARYIDFLIPGLIGLNLMGSSMWGIGFAIVVMRTKKLLKRFVASPMRRSDFLLSVMGSRLLFLAIEVVFLVLFGWLVFGVVVRGSFAALAVVSCLGAASFAGVAMLVASRVKTVEVASGLMNLVMIPMWLCSGSFFSYERFPEWLHPVVKALPLTALNDALRAVMNEGAPLLASWPEAAVMLGWGILGFGVSLKIFRWM